MAVIVKVEGVDEAIAALHFYDVQTRAKIAEAQASAANDTATLAKRLCPVDTGRLRSSIRPRLDAAHLEAEVYTDVTYAPFVEFGTGRAGAEAPPPDSPGAYDLGWPGAGAQPFLWPAWQAIRPHYIADVVRALNGYDTTVTLRGASGRFIG